MCRDIKTERPHQKAATAAGDTKGYTDHHPSASCQGVKVDMFYKGITSFRLEHVASGKKTVSRRQTRTHGVDALKSHVVVVCTTMWKNACARKGGSYCVSARE